MIQYGCSFICKSFKSLAVINTANKTGLVWLFIPKGKSLMYIMNNKGPKIDPWRTNTFYCSPDEHFCSWFWSNITTFCFLFMTYVSNHWLFTPHMPQENNLPTRISWLTEYNALANLQKILPVCFHWLNAESILSVRVKMGFSKLIPLLNPNCSGANTLLACKCWFNLLNITVSITFEKDVNSQIDL